MYNNKYMKGVSVRKNLIVIFIILFYSCGSDSSTNTSAGPNYHSNDYAFITELINTNTIDLDTLNMRITTITKEDLDRIVTMDLSNLGLESLPENINALKEEDEIKYLKESMTIELKPGDMLYMPPDTFHKVRNHNEPRISFSIPFNKVEEKFKKMDRTHIPFKQIFESNL